MAAIRDRAYRLLFKLYFAIHDALERRFFYYSCKALRMPHPKNLYDYRTRDFLAHIGPTDRVADLGCGTGKLVRQMASKAAFVLGIDVNPPADPNKMFLKHDILDTALPELLIGQGVNTITLSHLLEHIADPVEFLSRFKGFRKVLICVPSQENWRFQFKQSLGLDARTDPTHYREYALGMLREELETAGLHVKTSFYNSEGEIFAVCEN